MFMKKLVVILSIIMLLCGASTQAEITTPVISTFDTDSDGWTFDSTPISWQDSGGNPDGYMHYDNNLGGTPGIYAPEKFLGDWSSLNEVGTITYEANIFTTGSVYLIGRYQAYLSGPGGEATWLGPEPDPSTLWLSLSVPIAESEWLVNSGSWESLLEDVTSFGIETAYYNNWGPFEITGIDNVVLTPEPTTLLLFGLGSLALRKKHRAK